MTRRLTDKISASPALRPLDDAVEYIRSNGARVFPLYVAAVVPMTLSMLMLLDIVSTGRYSALPEGCMLLAAATVWKWIWSAIAQARVQASLSGRPGSGVRGMMTYIITLKLGAGIAMLWGSFMVLPAIYGFFLTGMAAPVLLDTGRSIPDSVQWVTGWIGDSMHGALKIIAAITLLFLVAYLGVTMLQLMVTYTIMPSLLGMDSTELSLTIWSSAWQMAVLYMLFLVFDFFWMVAAVLLYHDIQSRRTGADLSQRLTALGG